MVQPKANSRSRPDHMYPIPLSYVNNNSSSTQTAMECEPLPPISSKHGHGHRSRFQSGRPNALVNGPYGPYGAQRPYMATSHDGPAKLQTAQSSSSGQPDHDDSSPMVGVCVQQSPVVIH